MKKGLTLKLIIAMLSVVSLAFFNIGCRVVHNIDGSGLVFTLSADKMEYSVTDYTGLSTNVIIPTTYLGRPVTSIGSEAFNYCTELTNISIPNTIKSVGYDAFKGCTKLQYNIEGNLKYLGNYSNKYLCLMGTTSTSITSASINANCKVIGSHAFYVCSKFTSVVIPDSVTSIGDSAFRTCTSLTSVTIGKNVSSIGNYAFSGCSSLTIIIFKGTVLEWNAIEKGNYWKYYVPATRVGCSNGVVAIS